MVKQLLKGSVESLSNHIDTENEEQLKCVKIEIGTKVNQILTLAMSVDKGNKDAKLRKKSELTKLIDDFHKQYESLYALYDNLRGEIRQKVVYIDDGNESPTSTSNSDTEMFYSPKDEDGALNIVDGDILKDKLTSTSVVMETVSSQPLPSFSQVPESVEFVKDLGMETEHSVKNPYDSTVKLTDNREINPESYKPPPLLRDIECATDHFSTHSGEMVEKLITETSWLKEMISKKEEEMVSLTKKHQLHESERLTQIEELETQLANVKQDLEQNKFKSSSVTKKRNEEISKLQAQILELKSENNKKGDQISSLGTKKKQNELQMRSEVKDLTTKANDLQNELDKKGDQLSFLQNEKEQNELQMRSKIKDLITKVNDLQNQLDSLHKEKKDLEDQLCSKAEKAKAKVNELRKEQSLVKKEQLEKIYELHASLSKREDDLSSLHKEYKVLESEQKDSLQKLNEMEKRNHELINKVVDQEKMLVGMEDMITKLKDNQIQRKIDDIAEEFMKQFEDHLCILSRRIKVAEQLQVEVKEWYTNTRKNHAQEKYNVELTNVNDILGSLDGVALKFEECTTNFMNRISNVSCELKFAKDWIMRKKKTMLHIKDDQDCLLAQLDEKEGEILVFRERVWKYEIRERELENMVKEREEYMLGLKEEKREAIRQLCVWIDYHRSRCDYYKEDSR
ncbi:hypothetical protein Leryth_008951 [Lithospermum erythrorhizon]|nr:hypothetical protein Leryth_008951 [Lithospermum erythrorhizon]